MSLIKENYKNTLWKQIRPPDKAKPDGILSRLQPGKSENPTRKKYSVTKTEK